MKESKHKRITSITKYRQLIFFYIPLLFVFFTFVFLLLRFPEISSRGVKKGLEISFNSLLPSLYPFMICTELLISSGVLFKKSFLLSFLSEKLFSFPCSFPIFILSCLGGYPVGASCIKGLYEQGIITDKQGEKMLVFSVNPSLNFVLSFVGVTLLNSRKAGLIIYLGVILASLMLGIASKLTRKSEYTDFPLPDFEAPQKFSVVFTSSVKKAAVSMFYICAFTILFSAFSQLVEELCSSRSLRLILVSLAEVTNAVQRGSQVYSLPLFAFVLSFGGFSTVFQVLSMLTDMKIKAFRYVLIRVLCASLSFVITSLLLRLFPVTIETFSSGTVALANKSAHSVWVSAGLILMTFLFLAGDFGAPQKKT